MKSIAEDSTIEIWINTVDPATGAPVAPSAAFTTADFAIHKNGSATEKATTNGITVTSPFDSKVGLHLIQVDTSNDTGDSGFWVAAGRYQVRFNTAKTVGGVSVDGRIVPDGEFGIETNAVIAGQSLTDLADGGRLDLLIDAILQDTGTTLPDSISTIATNFLAHVLTKGTAGTIERAFWQILKAQATVDGSISGTPTDTTFQTNLTAADGVYDHQLILMTSGSLAGEARPIDSYAQANGVVTLQEAFSAAPSASDEFIILPHHVHPIADIATQVNTTLSAAHGAGSWLTGSGSGGPITPLAAGDEQRVTGTEIQAFVDEIAPISVSISDSAGTAVNLSGLTLAIHIEDAHKNEVENIASGSITVSGASNETVTFTPAAATSAKERTLLWSLRRTDTEYVLGRGTIVYKYAAND